MSKDLGRFLEIPIPTNRGEDKIIWKKATSKVYTVKDILHFGSSLFPNNFVEDKSASKV